MKYLIIILFLIALNCEGQVDSMVRIRPSTARYFLEKDDEVKIWRKKGPLDSTLISNLSTEISLQNMVIQTYKEDSVVYNNHIVTQRNTITLKEKENLRLK